MAQRKTPRAYLSSLARQWEEESRLTPDRYPYRGVVDEILFHADVRFRDYIQYREEGEFPVRLKKWLDNVTRKREKQILIKLLPFIVFIDYWQLHSLYRDAFRRVIVPWLCREHFTIQDSRIWNHH